MVAEYQPTEVVEHGPTTDCFVHQLLEAHRRPSISSPKSFLHPAAIAEHPNAADGRPAFDSALGRNHVSTQSRHLSKKQLSDMAFGVRELSKSLANIKLRLKVHNIFILGKVQDEAVVLHTRQLAKWLLKKEPYHRVYVENTLEHNADFDAKGLYAECPSAGRRLKFWDNELCARAPQIFDIVMALGGDGTVLYSSWLFQRVVPPVLAFALGSLGFLTNFDFDNHDEDLSHVLDDGFNVNLRLRFEATIMRNTHNEHTKGKNLADEIIGKDSHSITHRPDGSHHILNEVVLDRGPNGSEFLCQLSFRFTDV
jgi:NAD+ kinase